MGSCFNYSISHKIHTLFFCILFCGGNSIGSFGFTSFIYPYSAELLKWHCDEYTYSRLIANYTKSQSTNCMPNSWDVLCILKLINFRCEFVGEPCHSGNFSKVSTDWGMCYVFNTERRVYLTGEKGIFVTLLLSTFFYNNRASKQIHFLPANSNLILYWYYSHIFMLNLHRKGCVHVQVRIHIYSFVKLIFKMSIVYGW